MVRLLKDYGYVLAIGAIVWVAWTRFFPGKPDLPDQAPALDLPALDRRRFSLQQQRGHATVLNFWASWCAPCRQEIPEFNAFAAAHPEVAVIGVAVDSGSAEEVKSAARILGIRYTVLLADAATQAAWDISTLPTTVFIDGDGQVLDAHVGPMSSSQLERALAPTP